MRGEKKILVDGYTFRGNGGVVVVFGGYAAAQLQAVFDLRRDLACCKFAVGLQHRFPFNSSVHRDDALVLELRVPLIFIDHAAPPPRPPNRTP